MSIEHETTTDEIKALLNDDGGIDARMLQSGNSVGRPNVVTPAECADWRDRAAADEPQARIVEETGYSQPLVSYHMTGKCQCSEDDQR